MNESVGYLKGQPAVVALIYKFDLNLKFLNNFTHFLATNLLRFLFKSYKITVFTVLEVTDLTQPV